jgi:predicted AAA+ superfamily ATPase
VTSTCCARSTGDWCPRTTCIEPWKRKQERQVIGKAAKFYLFDVGVAGAITKRRIPEPRGEQFGRALEHFLLMEILAHRSYRDLGYGVHFWRTKTGLEVDFVLGDAEVAVEVKGTSRVDPSDFRSLRAFAEGNHPRRSFLVCNESAPRIHEGIEVLPWREFLARLWGGEVI